MNELEVEALRVIRDGLPDLPTHPIRGRWIPVARWRHDPWAAVWFVVRRKKTIFNEIQIGAYFDSDGWKPFGGGGGGGGCPAFVDPRTRQWRRPSVHDPWVRPDRYRYLIPSGMGRSMLDKLGIAPSSFRIWRICAVEEVKAVRVEAEGVEAYIEPAASPIGAFVVGIDDDHPSARLVPLAQDGREFGEGWSMAV